MRKQVDSTCVSDPSFFCSRTLLFSRSFPRLFSPWLIKWIFMLCLRMSDPLKSYFSLHSPSLYPTFWYFIDAKAYRRVSNPLYFSLVLHKLDLTFISLYCVFPLSISFSLTLPLPFDYFQCLFRQLHLHFLQFIKIICNIANPEAFTLLRHLATTV